MTDVLYAEILLPLPLRNTFTYSVPEEYQKNITAGSRVTVAFGKRKLYTGLVVRLHNEEKNDYEIKPVESVYEYKPIVNNLQLELWQWISEYYCCSLGEVFNAAISSIFIPDSESEITLGNAETKISLTPKQEQVFNILVNKKTITISELSRLSGINNPVNHIKALQEKGLVEFSESVKKGFKPQLINMLGFDINSVKKNKELFEKISKQGSKQYEILAYLSDISKNEGKDIIEIPEKTVLTECNCSKSSLKSLEEKSLIKLFSKEVSRIIEDKSVVKKDFELTSVQNKAIEQILEFFKEQKPVLLHGVTSSGKTEIYIRLIQKTLSENKTVLYLLPEIALTSQIINRLKSYFGELIGVYHSKYSKSERAEVYLSVLNKKLKIVLGARSSIFLPFTDLGLIIVDEEYDSSYKQTDPAPRYNARDTAVVLSKIHNADIVPGTATPSVESYYNTKIGKYNLVELNERYGKIKLPEIIPVDIKDGYLRKIMQQHFHPILINYVKEALDNKEQIILFQNRRGFSPYVQCADCGYIPICKDCNVSLTYHKFRNKLICHYCGLQANIFKECPECKSAKLLTRGMGTEQIEDEATVFFPEAKISRLDYDTTRTRKSYEKILMDFANHRIDILIGTQMVSKGLDFENVSLVGIMNADNMLSFPDFRAFERSFQMMAQVSGRAGRRKKRGRVVIQTFDINHTVLKNVINNDYKSLYESQIAERKIFKYPPFNFFIIIRLKHKNVVKLNKAAGLLANSLKKDLYDRVKGPEEPLINKIKNAYIKNIHIRFEKEISAKKLKSAILKKCDALKSVSEFSSVNIQIDVDPI